MADTFGGLLARAGSQRDFHRSEARTWRLSGATGCGVESGNDGIFTVPGKATDDPASVGHQELVLFTVKMYDNDDAIRAIGPMVGPGYHRADAAKRHRQWRAVGEGLRNADRVMIGSAYLEGRISEPGVVSQGGPGAASFGERTTGITQRGERLYAVFREAGWRVDLLENMTGMLWKKFAYLSGSAGVCAASGCAYGELRSVPETRAAIQSAIAEALAVGEASGAPLEPDSLEWSMNALDNSPATGMASLAKDFAEGRPVELEGLTGTVIRMGRELGVSTPVTDALYAVLKPRANRIEAELGRG